MSPHFGCLSEFFLELGETATLPSLEGVVLCRNFPFVNCVCRVSLAGQLGLELECACAAGRFGGKLHQNAFAGQLELELEPVWVMGTPGGQPHWGHLDRLVGAIVGVGSGHRESWGQAAPGPGAVAEMCVVCRTVQVQAKLGQEL